MGILLKYDCNASPYVTTTIKDLQSRKLYKLFNKDENHHGFQYKTGLNIDTIPFNPKGKCQPGGLYFSDCFNILNHLCYYNIYWIAEILLPDDVRVYIEDDKYKADKIILSEPQIFDLTTFEFTPELVNHINSDNSSFSLKEYILIYLKCATYVEDKMKTFLYLVNNVKIDFLNMNPKLIEHSIILLSFIFESCPLQYEYVKQIDIFRKHYTELLKSLDINNPHVRRFIKYNNDYIDCEKLLCN
jgi:hypothetical protein